MVNNILYTPSDILTDINLNLESDLTILSSTEKDGYIIREINFSGRDINGHRPRGYGMVCFSASKSKSQLLFILGNSKESISLDLLKYYALSGFTVFMLDYAGNDGKKEKFTVYPDSIKYANLSTAGRKLSYVDTNARETSGFEWIVLSIYALNAVLQLPEVDEDSGAGVLGIGLGANIAWMFAALDKRVKALCNAFSAGWYEYCGIYKYANENVKVEFDDERARWVAGMSVQAYSKFIDIPVMYLSGSNNKFTDMDRSYDTMARVSENAEKYIYFAPSMTNILGIAGGENTKIFFNKHLNYQQTEKLNHAVISINTLEEGIFINLKNIDDKIKSYKIYICEGQVNPSARYWKEPESYAEIENGEVNIKFEPKTNCKMLFAFANVNYHNGMTLSTNLAVKDIEKFNTKFDRPNRKSPVIYNSTFKQNCFVGCVPENPDYKQILMDEYLVTINQGAGKISGVGVNNGGIATYKITSPIFKGEDEEFLKFDIYSPVSKEITVFCLDKAGTLEEHFHKCTIQVIGGEMWQPVEVKKQNFKTDDGQPLKSWQEISLICYYPAEGILINNLIWI